jgi:uncharacterized membrane protein
MKNIHKLDQKKFRTCVSPILNQVEYRLFASTHINPFIFVVGNIFIVVPISHNNIRNNTHNLTMIAMFLESIQLGRQEFVFFLNGKTYDTLDLKN